MIEDILNESKLKTWKQVSEEYDKKHGSNHHHLKLKCPKCGNARTCRCSAPKDEVEALCPNCEDS